MTFKEFRAWANARACDGQWGRILAIDCMTVGEIVSKEPFWRKKRTWKILCEDMNLNLINRIADTDVIRKERGYK